MGQKTAIVGQNIYDFLGRQAVQVLPVPDLNQTDLCFRPHFNKSRSTNEQYDWEDFDLDNANCSESIIDEMYDIQSPGSAKGAAFYYSMRNTMANSANVEEQKANYIPDSEGYPFAVTEIYT